MRLFRYGLWALVFALGVFLAYATTSWSLKDQSRDTSLFQASVGGSFEAQLASGKAITYEDIKGKPHAFFFGFTHCPDICPTSLSEATQWLKELGPDGDKIDVYFVTVDPKRDTATILNDYISVFDKRIQGITGTEEQINALVKKWRVFAQKGEKDEDGDYDVSHTSSTFLMNSKGDFVRTIAYGESKEVAMQKLRKLIEEENS